MAPSDIVIVGTGGSGRETYALLRDVEAASPGTWRFRGFVATEPPDRGLLARLGEPFLGSPTGVVDRVPAARSWHYVLGIGSPAGRRSMDAAMQSQGLTPTRLIHPTALIGPDVAVGPGAVICAHCVITTDVRIGASVQLNVGCVVAHDARIGNYVTLAQSVNLAGNVTIGDEATIFTGAMILPGTEVGRRSVVGAGAVVRRDVPEAAVVAGVPARQLR